MKRPQSIPSLELREIIPGFRARMIHTQSMTFAHWEIDQGAQLPEHHHVHEQVVNMQAGEFELTVDGTPHRLHAGDIFVLESNVPHSGRAITDCKILDVFQPVRDDYRQDSETAR